MPGQARASERLLTNWYAYDQRIHGELKQRAEADLHALRCQQMKQSAGSTAKSNWSKAIAPDNEDNRERKHGVTLNSREWDETSKSGGDIQNRQDMLATLESFPIAESLTKRYP